MLLDLGGQNILRWQQELSGNDTLHNYLFFVMQGENHYIAPLHNVHHFEGVLVCRDPQCDHAELLQGNNVSL